MTRNQQVLYLALSILLVASHDPAAAATVVETVPGAIQSNSTTLFSFPDVANADQLVSVSAGNVFSPEGATFTISVDYSGASTAQIFSTSVGQGQTFNLNSISNISFAPGTINGLTFAVSGLSASYSIPAGTAFTFHTNASAVPEAQTWATMLLGLGAVGYSLRFRRRKSRQLA